MDSKSKNFALQFSEEELKIIYDVFCSLTHEGLNRWITLMFGEDNRDGEECLRQWRETDMFDEIRRKAGIALGVEESS